MQPAVSGGYHEDAGLAAQSPRRPQALVQQQQASSLGSAQVQMGDRKLGFGHMAWRSFSVRLPKNSTPVLKSANLPGNVAHKAVPCT